MTPRAAATRRPRLVSAAKLEALLGPRLSVLEVASTRDAGRFRDAHVPGSQWAYWKQLLWHETDRRFADPETIARRLGELGIPTGAPLVLVGDPIQFGAYAFWVLHMQGQRDVLLLDGGRRAWLEGGFPVESGWSPPTPVAHAPGRPDLTASIGREDVLAAIGGESVIVDFRSDDEFLGERVSPTTEPFDHGAERTGRIPGARHLYFERLLHDDGTFRSLSELRDVFAAVGIGEDDSVIAYCRLSHRASLGWFALTELLGREPVRVYDGSWTEWGSMVEMPVERPAQPTALTGSPSAAVGPSSH